MKASARIQVTLDVPISDTWEAGADILQIRKQAVESGLEKLRDILRGTARLVGEPKVTIVLVEDV